MSKRNRHSHPPSKVVHTASRVMVDIVIPVYGQFDFLHRCLSCIPEACADYTYKIILVDNATKVEEKPDEFYKGLSSQITVIRNRENLGFPKACNQGARRGNGEYIFFLNSDAFMYPNSIKNAVSAFVENVGVVGAKLLFEKTSPHGTPGTVQHVGMWTTINGEVRHAFIGWNPDHPKVLAMREVLGVTGAALMVKRTYFNLVNGFGEEYGAGTWEDLDLCLKVRNLGKSVIVCQSAVGEHWVGRTSTANQMPFPLQQNRSIFQAKWNYPWTQWQHV